MDIQKTLSDNKLTLALSGRLDTATSPALEAVVSSELDGITELDFDLSALEYVSSAGLRVLLSAQKIMNKAGKMTVSHACADVREIFEITGFSDILTLVD